MYLFNEVSIIQIKNKQSSWGLTFQIKQFCCSYKTYPLNIHENFLNVHEKIQIKYVLWFGSCIVHFLEHGFCPLCSRGFGFKRKKSRFWKYTSLDSGKEIFSSFFFSKMEKFLHIFTENQTVLKVMLKYSYGALISAYHITYCSICDALMQQLVTYCQYCLHQTRIYLVPIIDSRLHWETDETLPTCKKKIISS